MAREAIPIISDLIDSYYTPEEFQHLAEAFDLKLDLVAVWERKWMPVIKELVVNATQNNHQIFLKTLIESLIRQAEQGVGHTDWERRTAHQNALSDFKKAAEILSKDVLPQEISVEEGRHFSAKSETRQFLSWAETDILIVDPYIGLGTLDCLLDTKTRIRILTGERLGQIESDFGRHLKQFIAEGRDLDIRQHPKLHDRYVFFSDRCWLLGSSLKDAGKKRFNCLEVIDAKEILAADNEKKWSEASPYTG